MWSKPHSFPWACLTWHPSAEGKSRRHDKINPQPPDFFSSSASRSLSLTCRTMTSGAYFSHVIFLIAVYRRPCLIFIIKCPPLPFRGRSMSIIGCLLLDCRSERGRALTAHLRGALTPSRLLVSNQISISSACLFFSFSLSFCLCCNISNITTRYCI